MKNPFRNQMNLKMLKRLFDILISLILIFLLLPFLLFIIIILKNTGEGEIFYTQERIGKNKNKFKIIKFATMLKNSEFIGDGVYSSKNDPRFLKFGKFLRNSKINEIPQLINVIKNDMSLVGPRPLVEETFNFYEEDAQLKISSIKPGITGLASIFFIDEEQILENIEDKKNFYKDKISPIKQEIEICYISNLSFINDILILIFTLVKLFKKNNNFILNRFKDLKKANSMIKNLNIK